MRAGASLFNSYTGYDETQGFSVVMVVLGFSAGKISDWVETRTVIVVVAKTGRIQYSCLHAVNWLALRFESDNSQDNFRGRYFPLITLLVSCYSSAAGKSIANVSKLGRLDTP